MSIPSIASILLLLLLLLELLHLLQWLIQLMLDCCRRLMISVIVIVVVIIIVTWFKSQRICIQHRIREWPSVIQSRQRRETILIIMTVTMTMMIHSYWMTAHLRMCMLIRSCRTNRFDNRCIPIWVILWVQEIHSNHHISILIPICRCEGLRINKGIS